MGSDRNKPGRKTNSPKHIKSKLEETVEPITLASLEPREFSVVSPPIQTRPMALPFHELQWDVFEYAALRIAKLEGDVEYAARLGRPGQKQHGIDLFVLGVDGVYRSWQTKRWKTFKAKHVRDAVQLFQSGGWYSRSTIFVLCVSCDLNDEAVQEEIERQRQILAADGKKFLPLDRLQLSERCRDHPEIVDDLFGRSWASAFVRAELVEKISARLTRQELSAARTFLLHEYQARFRTLDASAHLTEASQVQSDFRRRVVRPDGSILANDELGGVGLDPSHQKNEPEKPHRDTPRLAGTEDDWWSTEIETDLDVHQSARVDLDEFLFSAGRTLVIGDAGYGKSTLLRCLALDLLTEPSVFPLTRDRLSGAIPILLPFSFWVRHTEARGNAVSLEDIVRLFFSGASTDNALIESLVRLLHDGRCVVLLDGLDEFTNPTAGRTALQVVETLIERGTVRVVATGRPSGVRLLGGCANWRRASLLELTTNQQRQVAAKWWNDFLGSDQSSATSAHRWISRFFDQLVRTGNLARIAGTPLILVGCLIVALKRGGALPRDKFGVFDALLDILVFIQPSRRELEALDTRPRRVFADDALPLECLSVLALAMLLRGNSSGLEQSQARKVIVEYLKSSEVDWSVDRAQEGADDLVGVSADTTGLIVERGPGEIGFLHASLRDHAAGRNLSSKPFPQIISFIKGHASEPYWHQVILSSLHHINRPTELAAAIEEIEERAPTSREALLLATIAAGSFGHRSPNAAIRIVARVSKEIEQGPHLADRAELLERLLEARPDGPAFKQIKEILPRWIPSTSDHRSGYYQALGKWQASPELRDVLLSAMEDDVASNRLAAAVAFGNAFKSDNKAKEILVDKLRESDGAGGFVARLTALAAGWPEHQGLENLLSNCLSEPDPQIQSAAVIAMFRRGERSNALRDRLLQLSSSLDTHYSLKSDLFRCLIEGWRDDADVRSLALQRQVGGNSPMDYDLSESILLGASSLSEPELRWLQRVLRERYFPTRATRFQFANLRRLAERYPEIKQIVDERFANPEKHNEYEDAHLAQVTRSNTALDRLLATLNEAQRFIFWPVWGLLEGWGIEHPRVQDPLKALLKRPLDQCDDFAEFVPEIVGDKSAARQFLLEMLEAEKVDRLDFVIRGFAKVTTPSDDEVVGALLKVAPGRRRLGDGIANLVQMFGAHPKVCEFALQLLKEREPPLQVIAESCGHDPNIRTHLLQSHRPLPAPLRNLVARHVLEHPHSHSFSWLTDQYDREAHLDTRIRLVIAHAEEAISDPSKEEHRTKEYLGLLRAVGPDYPDRRLSGFVGLLALNQLGKILVEFPDKTTFDAKLDLLGRRGKSEAALSLVADRWRDVTTSLGPDWKTRLQLESETASRWEAFAPHAWRSDELLDSLVQYCRSERAFVGASALAALARAKPSSSLLCSVCERVLFDDTIATHLSGLEVEGARLQAIVLLVDQFRETSSIGAAFERSGRRVAHLEDVFLALTGGNQAKLRARRELLKGQRIESWPRFLAIGSSLDSDEFLAYLETFLEKRTGSPWDFSGLCRRMVTEKLVTEPSLARRILPVVRDSMEPNKVLGLAEAYGLAWGLDAELREACLTAIAREERCSKYPRFARSFSGGEVRSLRVALSRLVTSV